MKLLILRKSALSLGIGVAMALSTTAGLAQDQQASGLEEVIVTAQKREQNMQDVPVAVTAFTGETLTENGITDVFDLQTVSPGLIVGQSQNSTTSNFSIRGVGTSSNNFGLESSVGLYVDGVYRARQSAMINNMIDVAAVEVLRGPQGTLFGKNTPSGAIQVNSVAPSADANGFFEITGGEFGQLEASAARSFSASDELMFRLTGFTGQRDGYVDDVRFGKDSINDRDRWGVRAQMLYEPSDTFSARVIADYSEIDEICCAAPSFLGSFMARDRPGVFGSDAILAQLGATLFPDDQFFNDTVALSQLPISQNEDRGISAELNWDLGSHTLTSVSGYRAFESLDDGDIDFGDAPLATKSNDAEQSSFSQELRLANNDGDRLNYVVGLYYFTQELDSTAFTPVGQAFSPYITTAFGLTPLVDGINQISLLTGGQLPMAANPYPTGTGPLDVMNQDHSSWAVFGQADFAMTDALTLTVGLRYTDEEKDLTSNFTQTASSAPPNTAAIAQQLGLAAAGMQFDPSVFAPIYEPGWGAWFLDTFRPRANVNETLKDDQVTGTVKLSWFATDDSMFYASYGTGYKSGGTNTDRINAAFNPLFGAETVDAFEIGMKADFPDQSMRLNVAAYQADVDDYQANSFTGLGFNLQNAGELETSGVEVEFLWSPTDSFDLTAAYARNIADYKRFDAGTCWTAYSFHTGIPDPGDNGTGVCSRTGERVSNTPEDFFVLTAKKYIAINSDMDLRLQGEWSFTGDQSMDGNNDPFKFQDSYDILNVSVNLGFNRWGTDLTLWARNALDEEYQGTIFDTPVQDGRLNSYAREPRTWGLTLRKTF